MGVKELFDELFPNWKEYLQPEAEKPEEPGDLLSKYTFTEAYPPDEEDDADIPCETNITAQQQQDQPTWSGFFSPVGTSKPKIRRPSWDKYFLNMCDLVATRATCDRKNVGCVIVKNNLVVSIGYNGSLSGLPHCIDEGCDIEDGHCVRVVHSEMNALCAAARKGISVENATAYCNLCPCWTCFKLLVAAGIKEIVYKESYGNPDRVLLAAQKLKQLNGFTMRQYVEF